MLSNAEVEILVMLKNENFNKYTKGCKYEETPLCRRKYLRL